MTFPICSDKPESLSVKMAYAVCKRFLSSRPFFVHICHLQWRHDATASVSSLTTLSHTLTHTQTHTGDRQERVEGKRGGEQERQRKRENTSSFNCVSECPSGLHYPDIRRNLSCLLLETYKKVFVVLLCVSTAAWSASLGLLKICQNWCSTERGLF